MGCLNIRTNITWGGIVSIFWMKWTDKLVNWVKHIAFLNEGSIGEKARTCPEGENYPFLRASDLGHWLFLGLETVAIGQESYFWAAWVSSWLKYSAFLETCQLPQPHKPIPHHKFPCIHPISSVSLANPDWYIHLSSFPPI